MRQEAFQFYDLVWLKLEVWQYLFIICNTLRPEQTRMSRRKRRHLKSLCSLTVSSPSRSHSGCLLHQGILLTPIPFVPWQSGLPFPRYNLTLKIQGQRQSSKYLSQRSVLLTHFLSVSHQGILSTPVPFVPWHSGLPFLRYNMTLTIQGQRYTSHRSIQMIHFLSVSHQGILSTPIPFVPWHSGLPFLRYNLNLKIQGQRSKSKVRHWPVSAVSSWLISLVFHIRASHRLPSLSFNDNRASHSWDTIWP